MHKHLMVASLLILGLIRTDSAQAIIVTYNFSGTVEAITNPGQNYVPTGVQNGSTFVGTFSYDNSAPGSGGIYSGTALNMSVTVTISGQYTYTLNTPTSADQIDLFGNQFEFFARGPTVNEPFAPNPPFSFFQFLGTTQSADILANATVINTDSSAGVSDAGNSPYYFIDADTPSVAAVPEPSSLFLVGPGAGGLLFRFLKRRKPASDGKAIRIAQETSN